MAADMSDPDITNPLLMAIAGLGFVPVAMRHLTGRRRTIVIACLYGSSSLIVAIVIVIAITE